MNRSIPSSSTTRATLALVILLSFVCVSQADLLYHFRFENAAGEKSLANSGKLGGEATAKAADGIECEFTRNAPSASGYALSFPMTADGQAGPRLVLPQSEGQLLLNKPDQGMTIAVWLKWRGPDNHPSWEQGIVSKTATDLKSGWSFVIAEKGYLAFIIHGVGQRFSVGIISANEWTHVAMTYKTSGGLRFYINGQATALDQPLPPFVCLPNEDFINVAVLGQAWHLPLNGALDDLRIYDEALPLDDIELLVKEGRSTPTPAAK